VSDTDIFISYSREDRAVARYFAQAFEKEGFNVWWDNALRSGETFDEVIERELRAAKAVVVLWSPRSVASRWVRAEATTADRNGTLAPAIIESCTRPIIFELTHTVDLSAWQGDTSDTVWQAYIWDLRALIEGKTVDQASTRLELGGAGNADAGASSPYPLANKQAAPSAPAPAAGQQLDQAGVEQLMAALSSLQNSMASGQGNAGQGNGSDAAADEDEATQILTGMDNFDLFDGDDIHCLEINVDGELLQRFPVNRLGLKIGRSGPADVVLADSKVSRSHCMVELNDGLLCVTDLKSTNGTWVDDQRIDGVCVLPVGSKLRVGNFILEHAVRTREEI
jgi:hypothetical protein